MAIKIVRYNKRYENIRKFIEELPDNFDANGEYVYDGRRNLIKLFVAPDGTRLNVKRYHKPRFLNSPVYSFGIRKPKGLRAFEYPQELYKRGFDTPEPIAYIEERHIGILGASYFISIQCDYEHKMYEFGDAGAGTYEDFCSAFGRYTAKMHDAGILHRDYSPGNILWTVKEDGKYHFSLVDINRMKFGHISMNEGCANFARLWGPKCFILLIARSYGSSRGMNVNECEQHVLKYRKRFWKHYMKHKEVEFKLEL